MSPPIAAIFVSSTQYDLQSERKAVAELFQRLRQAAILGRDYFGNSSESDGEQLFSQIAGCELYVGIIAGRYSSGAVEAQYRHARARGVECLIYLKDENVLQLGEQNAAALRKLLAFKTELRRQQRPGLFKDGEQLCELITADIHRWLFDRHLRPAIASDPASQLLIPADSDNGYRLSVSRAHGAVVESAQIDGPVRRLPRQENWSPTPPLIDREGETADALAALAHSRRLEITGAAGTGKSALMRYLADQPQLKNLPDGIIYRQRVGHQPVADLLQDCFAAFYDGGQVCNLNDGATRQRLGELKALILLDDVALADAELKPLSDVLSNCAIVITTSGRMRMDETPLYLRGLPMDDAVALIEREYGASLSEAEQAAAKHLALRLGRNPGLIRQIMAQLRQRQSPLIEYVAQLPTEEIGAAQVIQACGALERKIVALLIAAGAPIAKSTLIALINDPQLDEALVTLESARLIESLSGDYLVPANCREGAAPVGELTTLKENLLEYFIAAAESASAAAPELIELALDWAVGQERWPQVLRLARAMDPMLCLSKRWGAWQHNLELGQRAAELSGDPVAAEWFIHQLGSRALCLGDGALARERLALALNRRCARGDHWGAAVTQHNLDLLDRLASRDATTAPEEIATPSYARAFWSRLAALPLPLKGSILALLCLLIALVAWQEPPAPPPPALLSFSPNQLEFRSVALHIPALAQSVTVANVGSAPLKFGAAAVTGAAREDYFIQVNGCADKTLAVGGDCQIRVMFTPTVEGARVAALSLSDGRREPIAQIALRGRRDARVAQRSEDFTLTPEQFDLGARPIGSTIAAALTLTNTGVAALRVGQITISGAQRQDFSAGESDCRDREIPQRLSCTIAILFKPSGAGARSAMLSMTLADGASTELTLRGNGVEVASNALSVHPASLGFGAVDVGQRLTKNLLIQHQGRAADIAAIAIEGGAQRDFTIAQNDCQGGISAEGKTCRLAITFAPVAAGSREAALVITDATGREPTRALLYGSGKPAGSAIEMLPDPVEFSDQAIDSPPLLQRLVIRNGGSANLRLDRVEIDGADARQFAIVGNNCGDNLAGAATCNIILRYTPKAVASHRALLRVIAPSNGSREVLVKGSAVRVQKPVAAATPAQLNFPELALGSNRTLEVTVDNQGSTDLLISRAELRGKASFALLNQCPARIKPGGAPCVLRLRFTPDSNGSHDAELMIFHDGAGSPLKVPVDGAARMLRQPQ